MIYRFANHELDTRTLELRGADGPVPIEPKVLDTLHQKIQAGIRLPLEKMCKAKLVIEF